MATGCRRHDPIYSADPFNGWMRWIETEGSRKIKKEKGRQK